MNNNNQINLSLNYLNQLAKQYNTSVNSEILNSVSSMHETNNKYQLPAGSEKDFNNAATFFLYSTLKSSKNLDNNENSISSIFFNYLKKYCSNTFTTEDLKGLLYFVNMFNENIDAIYNIEKIDSSTSEQSKATILQNIFRDFFRMDISSSNLFSIEENSYAYVLYQNILTNYVASKSTSGTKYEATSIESNIILIMTYFYIYDKLLKNNEHFLSLSSFDFDNPNSQLNTTMSSNLSYEYSNTINLNDTGEHRNLANLLSNPGSIFYINNSEEGYNKVNYYIHTIGYHCKYITNSTDNGFIIPIVRYSDIFLINEGISSFRIKYLNNGTPTQLEYNSTTHTFDTSDDNHIPVIKHIPLFVDKNNFTNTNIPVTSLDNNLFRQYTKSSTTYYFGFIIDIEKCLKNKIISIDYTVDGESSSVSKNIQELINESINKNANSFYLSSAEQDQTNYFKIISLSNAAELFSKQVINSDNSITNITNIIPLLQLETSLLDNIAIGELVVNTELKDESYIILNSIFDPLYEYKLNIQSFKILYEIKPLTNKSVDSASTKLNMSDIENYYIQNKYNLNEFIFSDIPVTISTDTDSLYYLLSKLDSNVSHIASEVAGTSNNVTTLLFQIGIIYKEFNLHLRNIDCSIIQNRVLAHLYLSDIMIDSKNIFISTDLNDKIYNISNSKLANENTLKYFKCLKTNDYVSRIARESDLIAYLVGDIINFGNIKSELSNIDNIISLFAETRNYYYRVLLNKSFIQEDGYELYEKLFITAYTIERYVSSRIDHILDLNKFSGEDCSNFLISYGLASLNKQINDQNFSDATYYKKRLISFYNDLMSNKGSRAVIDTFLKIFGVQDNEIAISKYLLVNTNNTDDESRSTKFIKVPYESKNLNYALDNNETSAKNYDTFITNDQYWSVNDLPTDTVTNLLLNKGPQNTKYIGLQLKTDIKENFIKSKYVISLSRFLANKLIYNPTAQSSIKKYINLITTTIDINNTVVTSNILTLYEIASILFLIFNEIQSIKTKVADLPNPASSENTISRKYYGISSNNLQTQLFKAKADSNLYLKNITNIFETPIFKVDPNNEYKFSVSKIPYYVNATSGANDCGIVPFDCATTIDPETNNEVVTTTHLYSKNSSNTSIYLIPYVSQIIINMDNKYPVIDGITTKPLYTKFINDINGTHNFMISSGNNALTNTKLLNIFDNAFSSISLINFLNSDVFASEVDDTKKKSLLDTIFLFNKYKNIKLVAVTNSQLYPSDILEQKALPFNDNNSTCANDYYVYLYNDTLSFPFKYLFNEFKENNTEINKDARDAIDLLFNNYYLTDINETGYLSTADDVSINNQILNEHLNNIMIDTNASSYINDIISYLFGSAATITNTVSSKDSNYITINLDNNTEYCTIDYSSLYHSDINEIQTKLINVINVINDFSAVYENLNIKLIMENDISNFFEFIKATVSFFISYTANLYTSDLIYKYEDQPLKLSYNISEKIENKTNEYLYYDEEITVDEINI